MFIKIGSLFQKRLVSKKNCKIIQFKESLIPQPHFEHFELITNFNNHNGNSCWGSLECLIFIPKHFY
jgi:hypothetical protein